MQESKKRQETESEMGEKRNEHYEKEGNNEWMKRCGLLEVKGDDWRESFLSFSWQHIPDVFVSQWVSPFSFGFHTSRLSRDFKHRKA